MILDIDWDSELSTAIRRRESINEVAARLGVAWATVSRAARERGVILVSRCHKGIDWDAELMRAQRDGEHVAAIARRLSVAEKTARKAAARRGVQLNVASSPHAKISVDGDRLRIGRSSAPIALVIDVLRLAGCLP